MIITICGSIKFMDQMKEAETKLKSFSQIPRGKTLSYNQGIEKKKSLLKQEK